MAITNTALTIQQKPVHKTDRTEFMINFYSADASGTETIKAGVASTQIVVEGIIITSDGDEVVQVQDEDANVLLGPFKLLAAGNNVISIVFPKGCGFALPTDKNLDIDAVGAANIAGVVWGYTTEA